MGSFTLDRHPDDHDAPQAGDLLVSTRAVYRITGARPVDTRLNLNRWRLTTARVATRTRDGHWNPPVTPDLGCVTLITGGYGGTSVAGWWAQHGVDVHAPT